MNSKKIKPVFVDLNNADTLKKGVLAIKRKGDPIDHDLILTTLLGQVEEVDFMSLAFPSSIKLKQELQKEAPGSERSKEILEELRKFKLIRKHYLVISIEEIIQLALENKWGICRNEDFIYLFNGAYWQNINVNLFQKFLGEAAEKMGVPKFSARLFQFRELLYKQFLSTAVLNKPVENNDKVLINLQNGTFEIGTEGTRLRPFDHKDFLTYQLPFKYDPEAKADLFQKYLERVIPEEDKQKVLAEYTGSIFLKNGSKQIKIEKALILYGGGANGKSVFYEVLTAMLGKQNTSSFSLTELTDQSGYNRASIATTLVNYSSEIGSKMETELFKKMVSGEEITGRFPYGRPMKLSQYAKFIFNCNQLPADVERSNGFFRRFLIIPFEVTIPEEEQDKTLHSKIIESELSGVFNWVLSGLNRLLQQKNFTNCDAANKALDRYKIESDSVQVFLEEKGYSKSAESYRIFKELYNEYRCFCIDDGYKPVNKGNFKKRLERVGVFIRRINIGNIAYLTNVSK